MNLGKSKYSKRMEGVITMKREDGESNNHGERECLHVAGNTHKEVSRR
jgi:hypothetical protein